MTRDKYNFRGRAFSFLSFDEIHDRIYAVQQRFRSGMTPEAKPVAVAAYAITSL